jgi:hypothetical protein
MAVWGALCVLLGGRRKSILLPPLWVVAVLLNYVKGHTMGRIVKVAVMAACIAVGLLAVGREASVDTEYFQYAGTATEELKARIEGESVVSLVETYRQSGFMGRGIGAASTGMRHVGGAPATTWQEGGLPKLLVELGVIGLVAAMALVLAVVYAVFRSVDAVSSPDEGHGLVIGLLAFVIANGGSFLVSHQIYSDLTVVAVTGLAVGMVLSAPRWAVGRSARR